MRKKLDMRIKSLCTAINQFITRYVSLQAASTSKELRNVEKVLGAKVFGSSLSKDYSSDLVSMIYSSWKIQNEPAENCDFINLDVLKRACQKDLLNIESDNVFNVPSQKQSRCLLLSSSLHRFPWESIFDMPFTRILLVVKLSNSEPSPTPSDQIGYVINPSGDLMETERRFAPKVLSSTDFAGIIGKAPTSDEFISLLTSSRLFLYFGHGAGDTYVNASKIAKLDKIAPSLLIGCSSGKFQLQGEADPEGIPISYSKASADYIVANLWDVTDKDIDAFAMNLIDHLLDCGSDANVPLSVHLSRKVCNLKYINGAAPVIYKPFICTALGAKIS
jgi:Peptidase family C50